MKQLILLLLFIPLFSFSQNKILNIGHRGAKGHVAENTIESIKEAIRLRADGVEIDVFRCKSGEIVLFHDKTLDKLTDGKGKIENKTLTEIKKIKVLDSQYSIPTLDEVLKLIGREFFLNIELKGSNTSKRSYELVKYYIDKKVINPKNILFSSFNWEELKKLRKLSNDINIALLTEDSPLMAINSAKELNAVAINPNFNDLNIDIVNKIKNSGLDIYTWTVNKKKDIERIKKLNVSGIITDYPDRFWIIYPTYYYIYETMKGLLNEKTNSTINIEMKGFLKKREGELFIVIGILIIIYDYFYGIDTQDLLFFNQEFGIGLFVIGFFIAIYKKLIKKKKWKIGLIIKAQFQTTYLVNLKTKTTNLNANNFTKK